ncbi:hypothetical protein [Streptomyces sp. G7(2002)]|uniref:hypothetical protein n=1 Tax=Streptomyces sp. G7(2002) TaxID=2971798 RepID=UPI00237D3F3A|nr:hypothetical protein [Streptomyces sp. G7(2002)]WDT56992.1 hypothetical protein NUT86_24710 [Streptomyces sp. G7(2002)]
MGIESDQLVFDYLSRVGDLAQQRGLPAATRMRLVTGLRAEIDGQQADSVSGVKRTLARLGTPEAVVAAAGSADDRVPGASWSGPGTRQDPGAGATADGGPAVPLGAPGPSRSDELSRRWTGARDKLTGLAARSGLTGKAAGNGKTAGNAKAAGSGGTVPAPRDEAPDTAPAVGLPPHLAGADELGDDGDAPDWWRVEPAPFGPGETVPGFVGGIEIPEMWDRPEDERPLSLKKDGEDGDGDEDAAAPAERPLPRMLRRVLGRRRAAPAPPAEAGDGEEAVVVPARAPLSPVLMLAVLLLVAGAALGSWLALAGGWGLAYVSRRLSRAEAKFAALGVPGTVVGGLVVWLWGRFDGRWGEPLAQGRLGQEMLDALPGTARVAAVVSALFLVWRMRRTPQ